MALLNKLQNEILPLIESLHTACSTLEQNAAEDIAAGYKKEDIVEALKEVNFAIRSISGVGHLAQMNVDWKFPPQPEWFDHYLDQHYVWQNIGNAFWVERGVFGLLAVFQDSNALELCCGDGFNTRYFYSGRCKNIIAIDFDQGAIAHAKKFNQAENVQFAVRDIRYSMPEGVYDNIIWDAAIEHFTPTEIPMILGEIKRRLSPKGVLSGYTMCEKASGEKSLSHHEYEFRSKEDLARFFDPYFKNVRVFETIHPNRHNLYFYCSDAIIPFDDNWEHALRIKR